MPPVEVTGIGNVEVAHEFTEIPQGGLQKKVEVVVHKNVAKELDAVDVQRLDKDLQEAFSVGIVSEDVFPLVPSAGNVIYGTRILYP